MQQASAEPMMLLVHDAVALKAGIALPTRSWIMKRQTRVPASTVVRMNNASNRMAKWYQIAGQRLNRRGQAGQDLRHADRQASARRRCAT
jgi:hypothetical protein